MKKRIVALLLTAAMAVGLVACGSSSDTASDTTNDTDNDAAAVEASVDLTDKANIDNTVERESINIAWQDATTLAPWGTNNDTPGNYEVYEMLYECTSDGERYGVLADTSKGDFEPGCDHEDGTGVYTVYIYDYIKDHAGNAVTASDVAFSYNYQFANETTSGWDDFVEASAVDDTTVQFTFSQEQSNLGWFDNFFCRCFIVNEDSYNASSSKLANDMCGTGPYKFVSYTSGSSLTIEKNDDYWQTNESLRHQEQQANVRTITFQFISENAQRENGVATGSLDMVQDMAFESITDFLDGGQYADKANVQAYSQKFIYYLDANCSDDSPMGDENLRKAVFYAIDQDGIIAALGGSYSRLYAYANDYYSDYNMVDWESIDTYNSKSSVDPDTVQKYLDASSYNGETLIMMVTSTFADTATIMAAQLAAYNINVELLQVDNATLGATQADSTAWDMIFGMMAGDYNVQAWLHDFSYNNSASGTQSTTFIKDDEWNDLLNLCNTEDGHTAENMQAWWEMAAEHA
jgi:ABC-type transport system substrate-binding protein